MDTVASELGRLDILVNNAGAYLIGTLEQLTLEQFDETVAVNVRAPLVAIQAAVRHMPTGGRIINIGSLVNPGPTDTELNPADGPHAETINGFTALGHFAAATDVAAAVAFLAGPDGRYLTGASLNVDGGFTI